MAMAKWWFSMVDVLYMPASGEEMSIMNLLLKPLKVHWWLRNTQHKLFKAIKQIVGIFTGFNYLLQFQVCSTYCLHSNRC